ncbi:MAG: hypothetical protein IJ608_12250 [Lachnospiraceae bacterium]|nr:hypothetical protein [Lachnospiraceae bacterium]
MENRVEEKRIRESKVLSSTALKFLAFLIMSLSFGVLVALSVRSYGLIENNAFDTNKTAYIREQLVNQIWSEYYSKLDEFVMEINPKTGAALPQNMLFTGLNFRERNYDVDISYKNGDRIYSEYSGYNTPYHYMIESSAFLIDTSDPDDEYSYEDGGRLYLVRGIYSADVNHDGIDDFDRNTNSYNTVDIVFDLYINPETIETMAFSNGNIADGETNAVMGRDSGYIYGRDGLTTEYRRAYESYFYRYEIVTYTAIAGILFLITFFYLLCAAGHHRGAAGISGGVLKNVPIDIYALVWVLGAMLIVLFADGFTGSRSSITEAVLFGIFGALEAAWGMLFLIEVTERLKLNNLIGSCLVFKIFAKIFRGLKKIGTQLSENLPAAFRAALFIGGIFLIEFMIVLNIYWGNGFFVLWFPFWIILAVVVIALSLQYSRLEKAAKAITEGRYDKKLNADELLMFLRPMAESINSIGDGLNRAVEERLKSEHMKTELITNVSHDIKTPLTSIINYSELMEKGISEEADRDKLSEYAEVISRQSDRLKKLLEDLIEASKASTGNVEVNMERCEVGVMITQTVGEYEQKLKEREIELIVRKNDNPTYIMADARYMSRVFENLMSNIYKYAQEKSRAYLTLEGESYSIKGEKEIRIIFRNMSKYPLEIEGEDFKERFVRGDSSRHMEGNGLGLSIADSLVSLMGGRMDIVTDGDLFKVVLTFKGVMEAVD